MRVKRVLWPIVAAVAVCLVCIAMLIQYSDPLTSRARIQWRDDAAAYVRARLADQDWLKREQVRMAKNDQPVGNWFSADLLCFRNGEWMVCRNICQKENSAIKDLFIGCGSDGKWYYSTFHFCRQKIVLGNESQPESLAKFVDGYWLVPFDGRSNDSLKETWDRSQPYGDFK